MNETRKRNQENVELMVEVTGELRKTVNSWLKLWRNQENGKLLIETYERTQENVERMVETTEKSRKLYCNIHF